MNPFKLKSTEGFCSELAKCARQGKVLALALSLTAITSYIVYAQSRGIPSQLRVKIDATGALAVSSAAITNPVTTTVFTNARLKVDSSGNLVITDGSGAGFAPASATYILKTTNASLANAQSLGALASGLLLNTSAAGTGTLSQYAGSTCTNQFVRALSVLGVATCNTVSLTLDVTGTLPVANGGWGLATLTAHDIYVGNGTSAPSAIAGGTNCILHWVASSSDPTCNTRPNIGGAFDIGNANSSVIEIASSFDLAWSSSGIGGTIDNDISRQGAQRLNLTNGVNGGTGVGIDFSNDGFLKLRTRAQSTNYATFDALAFRNTNDTNGQNITDLQTLTELTTIAAAATTDTTIQMPANSVVLGVTVRVTTVIPTCATFTVGDSGSAARFSTAAVSCAATSTDPGTKAAAYYNASALSIRITPNAQPAANTGRVRVTIYYYTVTPSTS